MKPTNLFLLTAVAAIGLSSNSCSQYAPNTKSGAVIGGLIGAGAGALIGDHSGRGLEGAAIGAAAGALGGGLIGSARDDRERQYYNEQQRRQQQYDNGHGHGPPQNSGQYYQHDQRQPRYY